ncbi:MAG: type II toxin-antitoxin system RelE/ParE family toxin [Candidatus Dadabacteria bacterium]|nr:type II toxin-antitoxin system RelE/ParE family toxin [Candidatus Dadabacteria bacterium]
MGLYRFTKDAANDFEQIYIYGIDKFGLNQATKYQNRLKNRFSELTESPLLFPAVDHIRKGCRKSVCGVHSIYYRIDGQDILIVRILGRQDREKVLEK